MTGECFCLCWSSWLAICLCAVPTCVCVCAYWEYPLSLAVHWTWGHGGAAALLMWGYWIWQPLTVFLHKPRECFLFPALLESIHSIPTCSCSRHDHTRQNKPINISVVFKKSVKPESFAAWGIQLCSKANSLNVTFYPSALCLICQCTCAFGYIQNPTGKALSNLVYFSLALRGVLIKMTSIPPFQFVSFCDSIIWSFLAPASHCTGKGILLLSSQDQPSSQWL